VQVSGDDLEIPPYLGLGYTTDQIRDTADSQYGRASCRRRLRP
jgi:hypothetical protein